MILVRLPDHMWLHRAGGNAADEPEVIRRFVLTLVTLLFRLPVLSPQSGTSRSD